MPDITELGAPIKQAYEGQPDTNDYTDAEKAKLAGVEAGAQVNTVTSVAGKTGAVSLSAGDVGLPYALSSDATGITGATTIGNIVQISQAAYDALDPVVQNANTFIIVG